VGPDNARVMPMFPLESVRLPGEDLPLRIFEPRYAALVRDCLAGEREFGVVLIEAGREVGGGDRRLDVGTLAHVVEADDQGDGRYRILCEMRGAHPGRTLARRRTVSPGVGRAVARRTGQGRQR
jgi:Lon protease-like protein